MKKSLKTPEFGEALPAAHAGDEAIALLWRRRSTPADFMSEPGPGPETLNAILTIGARVPDHRRVTPFRFVLFDGEARAAFGDVLAETFAADNPGADEARIAVERNRFMRAPLVIAVISSVRPEHKTPIWEQTLTAGAVCQNILLASSAFGFAAQWITEWYAFHDEINTALSMTENEKIAGFIYIGTAKEDPKERARPELANILRRFN